MTVSVVRDCSKFSEYLNIFSSPEYLGTVSADFGWFVSDLFVLAFVVESRLFIRRIRFMSSPISLKSETSCDSEKLFLEEVISLCSDMKIDLIAQPPTHVVFRAVPSGAKAVPFGSFRLDLQQKQNLLFEGLNRKHRNVIRKAEKDGVVVSSGPETLPLAVSAINATMRREAMAEISPDYIDRIRNSLGEYVVSFVSTQNSVLQAAIILLWNRHSAYYVWGGTCENAHSGALTLVHWHAIQFLKSKDVTCYDFVGARIDPPEGSKFANIQRFKERFGGELYRGFLWKYNLNHTKALFYQIAFKAKATFFRRRYTGDIIEQELKRMKKQSGRL